MRRIIVDGYNVLRGTQRYAEVVERDLDAARHRLIADLGARAGEGELVTVVFDGAGNPDSKGEPEVVGGVTVVFSPSGVEADTVIEALASQARDAGDPALVVTSDGATRWTALGGTVAVQRSESFAAELEGDEQSWREHAGTRSRVTVSEHMDTPTRSRLSRISRGESSD